MTAGTEAKMHPPRVMSGNEACAEGALAGGLNFFAGYPITPSSEIAEQLAIELPKRGGGFIQMEDEIASMGAIIGASLGGARVMTATSGPGFSLKQENLGFASMAEIPCVVVNVMRGGPSTGLPTMVAQGDVMQARWGTHGDHPIIAIAPNSVNETFHMTIRALNLADKYRTPVVLLLDEILGHTEEKVQFPEQVELVHRKRPSVPPEEYLPYQHTEDGVPPMARYGDGYRFHVTGLAHDETGFPTNDSEQISALNLRLARKLEQARDDLVDVVYTDCEDAELLVFAYGSAARSANEALRVARASGIKVGLMRPRTIWPFCDRELREIASRVKSIIVPELNLGQLAHEVEWAVCGQAPVRQLHRVDGQPIRPSQIVELIQEESGR
jgi:2-oxoglutarate ferredoxin oxidoreductase subunit alpha